MEAEVTRIGASVAMLIITTYPAFADHFNDQELGAWHRSETADPSSMPFDSDPTNNDKWEDLGWRQFENTQKAWENRNRSFGINNQFGIGEKGYYANGKGAIDGGSKDPGGGRDGKNDTGTQ
jgi:hypothetical protein